MLSIAYHNHQIRVTLLELNRPVLFTDNNFLKKKFPSIIFLLSLVRKTIKAA